MQEEMSQILQKEAVEALLLWYGENARDLPWRRTHDPYCIWISEIMLQQTRVEAVKPYYARFLEALPDIQSLANVPEQKLLKLWEGLGYYSRARNLQKAAKQIVQKFDGKMPAEEKDLKSLPGIGNYTAGAIASIAFERQVPAVDGNVLRVLSRVVGSYEDITREETKVAWSNRLRPVVPTHAGAFTQSLIELGAMVCVPNGEAKCGICPLAPWCVAKRDNLTDILPIRAAKKQRRIEDLTVLLIRDGDRTALHKRGKKGLLSGLWELPNLAGHLSVEELPQKIRELGFEPLRIVRIEDAKHIFTHIEWNMVAYSVQISPEFDGYHETSGYELVKNTDLHSQYPIPSAFATYLKYL